MANSVESTNSVDQSPEKGIVVHNIVIRPVVRKSQDIENWRNAIKAAEAIHPIYIPLYDLFEELLLDGVLENLIKKNILGVTKTKIKYVDGNGEEVPAMTKLIGKRQFRRLRKAIKRQQIFGPTAIELINDAKGFRIYDIPKKHIRPKEGLIVWEQYGNEGIYYRNPPANKFILEVGEWNDFGLLMKAAPYVIYKRGGFGDWSSFAELFGMPFREARYDGFNEPVRIQLQQAMEQMGSASYAILPKDSEFKLHETRNAQQNGELYNTLRKACNEELSILFLGQTETTAKTQGSLGGNDDTHEQTEDDINTDDKADELSIFNEDVKPILINLGLCKDDGGSFVYEEQEEDVPIDVKIDNVIRLRNEAKLPIEDEYIYGMTGIPKPADYDAQKKKLEEQQQQQPPQPPQPGKDKNGKSEKLSWKRALLRRLNAADFFAKAPKS